MLKSWLETQPSLTDLNRVHKEMSGRDKGAAKVLKEAIDSLKREHHQEELVVEWTHKAQHVLGQHPFVMGDALAWVRDAATSRRIISRALDLGINTIDTCDAYCKGVSEAIIGDLVHELGVRDRLVIATKLGLPLGPDVGPNGSGFSRKHIILACEASLRRLKTDYVDLYQAHRMDIETPLEETLRAFDDLVRQGKVRYICCSNLPSWQVVEAEWIARRDGLERFVSCQDEYSLIVRDVEKELIPAMNAYGIGLLPYFPLASGMLTEIGRAHV